MTVTEYVTAAELAKILGVRSATVRMWCRHGIIPCHKRPSNGGKNTSWIIEKQAAVLAILREQPKCQ